MTEKIGSYPRPGAETKPAGSQSAGNAKRTATAGSGDAQPTPGGDEVSLTDTVTRLKSIEARIQELPDVDRERVEELRRQIDAGEYQIDTKLVAQRLVQLEQSLS